MSKHSRCPQCRLLEIGSCPKCKESKRISQQKRRDKLTRIGLCINCGKVKSSGICEKCKRNAKKAATNKNGNCTVCGCKREENEFIAGKNLCKRCSNNQNKKRRLINRDKYNENHKKWVKANIENWLRVKLISINSNNRNKNRKIEITIDDLVDIWRKQNGKCALTGIAMTHEAGLKSASIDRKDSILGYTLENVQLVCKTINLGKNTYSNNEMITFIDDIRKVGYQQLSNTQKSNNLERQN